MSKNKSSIDLLQKSFDKNLKGEWLGNTHIGFLFLDLYISKKYSDTVFYAPYIFLLLNFRQYNKYDDYSFGIGDYNINKSIEFNNSEYPFIVYKYVFQKYFNLYRNTKKRFTIFPVNNTNYYKDGSEDGHFMIMIYDNLTNELEIFDTIKQNLKNFKPLIKDFFQEIYGKSLKIIYPEIPKTFGMLSYKNCKNYNYDSIGFCIVWGIWYVNYRLANLQKSRQQVLEYALNKFKKGETVCKIIRGYALFIENTVKDYSLEYKNNKLIIINKNKKIIISKIIIGSLGIIAAILFTIKKFNY